MDGVSALTSVAAPHAALSLFACFELLFNGFQGDHQLLAVAIQSNAADASW